MALAQESEHGWVLTLRYQRLFAFEFSDLVHLPVDMAPRGNPEDGTDSPQAVVFTEALAGLKDAIEAATAAVEAERGSEAVFLDANESYLRLPLEVAAAARQAGAAFVEYDGGLTSGLASVIEELAVSYQHGVRSQFSGCTAFHRDGKKCTSMVRGPRNVVHNLCNVHIGNFRLFSSLFVEGWRPVRTECTNCSAEDGEGDLAAMQCFKCGTGLHTACLARAFNSVEPGKLPAAFGEQDSQFFVCSQCVGSDWAGVLMESEFIVGQQPAALFAVCPPGSSALEDFGEVSLSESYGRFEADAVRGLVPDHFLVAFASSGGPQTSVGGGSGARRSFRGGSAMAGGSIPTLRPGRRPAGQADGPGRAASVGTARQGEGSSAGGSRLDALQRQMLDARLAEHYDFEAQYDRMKDKFIADGFLASHPSKGAIVVHERPVSEALVEGRLFGTTTGQQGSYDAGDAHAVESYHGQGDAQGPVFGKRQTFVYGTGSVSVQPQTFDPDSKVKQKGIKMEDGSMVAVETTSLATPLQHSYFLYCESAIRGWIRVAGSGIGVFDPDHPDHDYHMAVAHLIVMRYYYLLAVVRKLQQGKQAVHWEVVWRYVTALIAARWAGVLPIDSRLDLRLLEIAGEDEHRRDVLVAAAVEIDPYMLQVATESAKAAAARAAGTAGDRPVTVSELEAVMARMLAASAKGGGAGGGAGGGDGARQAPANEARGKKKCPLCLSADHSYYAGNYGHKEGMRITQACTKLMADGAPCGKRHAFTGPLQSPCREAEGASSG